MACTQIRDLYLKYRFAKYANSDCGKISERLFLEFPYVCLDKTRYDRNNEYGISDK